jgi:hypothetical protein
MRVTSTALQIACCVKRARIESKKLGPIEGDMILSHTEKEAIRVSNSYYGSFDKVQFLLEFMERGHVFDVYNISKSLWPRLAHPWLLVREVLES